MSNGKLKTAILGLNEPGQLLLKAASELDYFEVQAVADKDTKLAEKVAEQYKCAFYDDYRQLVMQNQFDCLIVAAGIHTCDEHIRAAMKKKFNILKLTPPARNFGETAEFVKLAESENVKFAVVNTSRLTRSFLSLRRFLQEGRIEKIFLVTAFCAVDDKSIEPWQTDPKLAGGGVLLHNCYQIIDQIVCNFDTPQQVYAINTNQAADKQQRLYLTEDTSVVSMKFSDTFSACIIVSKAVGPEQVVLNVYGKDKILTVSSSRFAVSDAAGRIDEEFEYDDDQQVRYSALVGNFALSILWPDENKLAGSARDNLKDMAVIESAYLSARTGFPEEPARILNRSQIETINA